jgi:hypothetical protein
LDKPTLIDAAGFERLGRLSRSKRVECLLALHDLREAFGRPHQRTGLSIRKLRAKTFNCRANIKLRYLFENRPECLYVFALADHDDVRRMLWSQGSRSNCGKPVWRGAHELLIVR